MKIRITFDNDYGFTYDGSIELDVDIVPRIGDSVWIDMSPLYKKIKRNGFEKKLKKYGHFYGDGESGESDMYYVVDVYHQLSHSDRGVYIILVNDNKPKNFVFKLPSSD